MVDWIKSTKAYFLKKICNNSPLLLLILRRDGRLSQDNVGIPGQIFAGLFRMVVPRDKQDKNLGTVPSRPLSIPDPELNASINLLCSIEGPGCKDTIFFFIFFYTDWRHVFVR